MNKRTERYLLALAAASIIAALAWTVAISRMASQVDDAYQQMFHESK